MAESFIAMLDAGHNLLWLNRNGHWSVMRDTAAEFPTRALARKAMRRAGGWRKGERRLVVSVDYPTSLRVKPLTAADIAARQASYPKARED